jgi:hypothetical protein
MNLNYEKWEILQRDIIHESFDFDWDPPKYDMVYDHIFGSDKYPPEISPCIKYKGHTRNIKYVYEKYVKFKKLDIFYISSGEPNENDNYNRLCDVSKREVKWIKNIKGRNNAIKMACTNSTTEWALVFPSKIKVTHDFDFDWQPIRDHNKRHFIFYASNPVNGLVYGHMAPVAYNCDLVMKTTEYGLDFTMSQNHDIVPINAGVAEFNIDPYITWRTSFRECIKLKHSAVNGDNESLERLKVWLTVGENNNGIYSVKGANDAIDYYNEVNGDYDKLKLSFDWEWCKDKYINNYYERNSTNIF